MTYIRKPVLEQSTGEYVTCVMPNKSPIAEPTETICDKSYQEAWDTYRRLLKMNGVFN